MGRDYCSGIALNLAEIFGCEISKQIWAGLPQHLAHLCSLQHETAQFCESLTFSLYYEVDIFWFGVTYFNIH